MFSILAPRKRAHSPAPSPAFPVPACPPEAACRAAAPAGAGLPVRPHPPPNQPGTRSSGGAGMPRPRRVARPPPTLLSLSVFTLLASIN
jgi:hypothetical protein